MPPAIRSTLSSAILASALSLAGPSAGAAEEAGPSWHLKLGVSFLATTGNTRTSSTGLDLAYDRNWTRWAIEGAAAAVRASEDGVTRAENMSGQLRGKRRLTTRLEMTLGARGERDRFSGIDFRSVIDASLLWKWLGTPSWRGSALAGLSYNHEDRTGGDPARDFPGGLVQLSLGRKLSDTAEITAEATLYPDLQDSADYRVNARAGLQAALSKRLALKLDYELKYDNRPVPGFGTTDSATRASLVLRLGDPATP